MKNNNYQELNQQKQNLLQEYRDLAKENKQLETIVEVQVRRHTIRERQKAIEEMLLEINCELLKDDEELAEASEKNR